MKKILINFYHPRFEDSNVHKALLEVLPKYEGSVILHDQYELYPDFDIDIKTEQQYLSDADIIIFQHPIFWYNCPPLMKQWLDLVLEYGWAYGKNGDKLKNKKFVQVVSTAGGLDAYQHYGQNKFTLREFLRPFEQTAYLCNMEYLPPLHIPNTNRLSNLDMTHFVDLYEYFIQMFIKDSLEYGALKKINYLNDLSK